MNMNRLFTCLCLSLLFNLAQAQLPIPEYQKGRVGLRLVQSPITIRMII